jgi:hypothetical protein
MMIRMGLSVRLSHYNHCRGVQLDAPPGRPYEPFAIYCALAVNARSLLWDLRTPPFRDFGTLNLQTLVL